MRSENEVINAIIEQVLFGIKKLGWDCDEEWSLRECVEMAEDVVMTDEEADAYGDGMTRTVMASIIL